MIHKWAKDELRTLDLTCPAAPDLTPEFGQDPGKSNRKYEVSSGKKSAASFRKFGQCHCPEKLLPAEERSKGTTRITMASLLWGGLNDNSRLSELLLARALP